MTETLVWLVLEYCPGDELYNHLLEHGRMNVAQAQKVFTQLVGAVSYVHAKQCVHRDLKLENILLDKHGNVKLVDFGFTREYQGTANYLQTWCGTVCYSAPEMLKGEKYAGEKVDLWSLGIILYALLCGELPFDADDDATTKSLILTDEPKCPDHVPAPAKSLIEKLLSKRPLLRPSLSDILKEPWLSDYAPLQQEILKINAPPPFSTELEKETLERMRSAGVDIDVVIENVLSQRCDALAGWWTLLIEKEMRKQRRRERKRKEREADIKSLRRLSAASGRLLGGINEGEEITVAGSPGSRGRRLTRTNGKGIKLKDSLVTAMPQVVETKSITPEPRTPGTPDPDSHWTVPGMQTPVDQVERRSTSRPPPPPKDSNMAVLRRPRNLSRGSSSMLRNVTTNPQLLSPSYMPPPQRKRRTFYQQPLREHLAAVKHWFKEGTRRAKSPTQLEGVPGKGKGRHGLNQSIDATIASEEGSVRRELTRLSTAPTHQYRRTSIGNRPELLHRATLPARPRLDDTINTDSSGLTAKRQSLSPHTNALTPRSSYRRSSAGLRGRKSTSSSVSSIRSTYQPGHGHSLSKASSTSSTSIASPSGVSSASGPRLARSPHASVKVLTSTPTTGSFPSNIRVSRRPPPANIGTLPNFAEAQSTFGDGGHGPGSPGVPVFARRKRSVFKGPMGGTSSPSGYGRVPMGNAPRRSGDMMLGVTEEEEEDEEEDEGEDEDEDDEMLEDDAEGGDEGKWEEVDQFGPELGSALPSAADDAASSLVRSSEVEPDAQDAAKEGPG